MEIKFCERDQCFEPAIGTGIRPVRWCRPHYLEEVAGELVRVEVVDDVPITDARTGVSVDKGGTVELDPVETRIEQLVYARLVKVLPGAPPAKSESKKG